MNNLSLISPSKINLFLKIVNRRSDGYHNLASLFQTISLSDTLHIERTSVDFLSCNDSTLPNDRSNLVWKAVDLFRRKTGENFALNIHLEKNIPHQAGLGGGSGNAATMLWALNKFSQNPVSESQLAEWSSEIGSDIPFFFSTGTAYCTGRGEIVESVMTPFSDSPVWIVKPNQGLSTPEVYRNLRIETLPKNDPLLALKNALNGKYYYFNDLELAAFKVLPSLEIFKENLLESGFQTVLLSGSGSSFFCLGEPKVRLKETFYKQVHFVRRTPHNWY